LFPRNRPLHCINRAGFRLLNEISDLVALPVCRGSLGGCFAIVFSLLFTMGWCAAQALTN
jgi:hypothetical protein